MDGRRIPIAVGMLLAGLLAAGPVAAEGPPPPKKLPSPTRPHLGKPPSTPPHPQPPLPKVHHEPKLPKVGKHEVDVTTHIDKNKDRLTGFKPTVAGLSPFGTGPHHTHHAPHGPKVERLVVTNKPVKGKPTHLKLAATATTGVTGASFDFGEPGGRYAESQCRLDERGHPHGHAAARDRGHERETFSVPYAFATPGPHLVRFELTSGACDRRTEVSAGQVVVDVLAPATRSLRAVTGPLAGVLSTNCPNADVLPTHETRTAARIATACLINEVRKLAGRRQLQTLRVLRRIAAQHSRDMVERRYFDHTAPGGGTLASRMHSIDWQGAAGENIGYGSAWYATPRSMMWLWMHSSGHRQNILDPGWRFVGVAIALGAPTVTGTAAATYTTDFGGN